MNPTLKNVAAAYIVPTLLSRVKLRWVAFGVIAYYGLKILNEKGILPVQAGKALDAVDRGIDVAKEQIGFSKPALEASTSAAQTSNPIH